MTTQSKIIDTNNRELFKATTALSQLKQQHIELETHHQHHLKELSYQNSVLKDDLAKLEKDYDKLEADHNKLQTNYSALLTLKDDLKEY